MTKVFVLLLFVSFYKVSFSQENKEKCNIEPFEVFTEDNDDFSNIRADPQGTIILKLNNKHSYGYMLNVIDMKDGWMKINTVTGVDGIDISNFEGWIHNSIVGATVTHDVRVYDKPNSKNMVGELIGEQHTFKIKEAYCEWIKIECKSLVGWVKSEQICGNPVTTCP
ncbi:hypothetical protein [Maribacter sp. 2-571]|uniref:hypothetical protein n=1 Tax=Maribacter sp. 2-571 TaxID=3417569 RepID=UPI003D33B3CD